MGDPTPDKPRRHWLESASNLLAEPDPGPTPFLVDGLLVDGAIAAIQGPPKAGKTWLILELAISTVTGEPAFGRYEIPSAGPVMLILEESGREALYRRLDALSRGRNIKPESLGEFYFAANARVRLNDPGWQKRLVDGAKQVKPRGIFLDPLVRLKGSGVDENSQREMAPVLDFMRDLRDATSAAVAFVHHTGYSGTHMRGSSDLEGYWESKVTLTRNQDGTCELTAEHREAEASEGIRYRRSWDEHSRSMRLVAIEDPGREQLRQRLLDHLQKHAGESTDDIAKAIRKRKADTRSELISLEQAGTAIKRRSEKPDRHGRPRPYDGWYPASQSQITTFPDSGNATERQGSAKGPRSHVPGPIEGRNGNMDADGRTIEELESIAASFEAEVG
jgi:hypothetical protein